MAGVFKAMFNVDGEGMVVGDPHIKVRRFPAVEKASMETVSGIIIHQTDSEDESAVFSSYGRANANGAHFLIARNGVIYQTASLLRSTRHVGKIKARCLAEHRCTAAELVQYRQFSPEKTNRLEMLKSVPQRYPSNFDSIGIEAVGKCRLPGHISMPPGLNEIQKNVFMEKFGVYDPLTGPQQTAPQYLVRGLADTLKIPSREVHKHPDISYKQPTEASTAVWK